MKKATAWILWSVLFVTLLIAALIWANSDRFAASFPQSMRASIVGRNLEVISGRLKLGMPKSEVAKIVGLPQNSDDDHVWMWVHDYNGYVKSGQQLVWTEMSTWHSDGLFVVFIDDRLATGLYANSAATPVEALKAVREVTREEAAGVIAGKRR